MKIQLKEASAIKSTGRKEKTLQSKTLKKKVKIKRKQSKNKLNHFSIYSRKLI
jgi:hypothetical protein